MSENLCTSCRSPKAQNRCGVCSEPVCRSCVEFLDAEAFAFIPVAERAPELKHSYYCQHCFDAHVAPAREQYDETMKRAREVFVFFRHSKNIPLLKRGLTEARIDECGDRDETILRLAFLAARQGFNAIVDADVESTKVRNAGYQKSVWRGRAVPAQIDEEKMARR